MFKALSNLFRKDADMPGRAAKAVPPSIQKEDAPIYESLALTDELREALFPTTPRMVSAVFDRRGSWSASSPDPQRGMDPPPRQPGDSLII